MATSDDLATSTWFLDLLRRIERAPGMFIGAEDVASLRAFESGYHLALRDAGREVSIGILRDFSEWLATTEEGRSVGATRNGSWMDVVSALDPSPRNVRTFYPLFRRFLTVRRACLSP